ncbi:unnamed protein product [Orchesella dallaii]|uniref:Transmembrane protein n=1 Tax=Orchesella dallaii TaxID=48710 RepID=A0ABP1QGI6_9HEXA
MASPSDSGMEDETEQEECTCLERVLKPLTKKNIIHHYIPLAGTACYSLMSIHFVKPSILRRITSTDPTNVLLTASLAGSCLYVYDRKHLKSVVGKQKISFSVFSAGLFNLGSILLWAMIRSATTSRDSTIQTARVALAVGSSVLLVKTGMEYLNAVDSQITRK